MRDLKTIDQDIVTERVVQAYERRAGDNTAQAQASAARIDALLDERSDVVRALPDHTPRPVDARLVR